MSCPRTKYFSLAGHAGALLFMCLMLAVRAVHADDGGMRPAGVAASGSGDPYAVLPNAAVGTAFTYQGRLLVAGAPAAGPHDFEFRLFDAAVGGAQLGATQTVDDAAVAEGRFTVALDFGSGAFGGGARWLDIAVRPGAGGAYTTLAPRQALSPAPYALALPNVHTNEITGFVGVGRDFQISGNEDFGVQSTTGPNAYGGMYVNTNDAAGWPFYGYATNGVYRAWTSYDGTSGEWKLFNSAQRLVVPGTGGLQILNTTSTDALRINDSADDGLQVGNGTDYPNYGVYIPSPGVTTYGLWSNTAQPGGNFALYTVDNIEAGVVTLSAQTVVARVAGGKALLPGDVAAAAGVGDPVSGATNRLAVVQAAGVDAPGVIGVVASRMEWRPAEGEAKDEMVLMPADGPAKDGDYVSLVVLGVADVRLAPGAAVDRGMRLTAAETGGAARALRTETLNGMKVTEGAPVVGVALEDARGRDTVPVFVQVR